MGISLKFVPKGPVNNKLALVQVVAWHQTGAKILSDCWLGDKPLLEQVVT